MSMTKQGMTITISPEKADRLLSLLERLAGVPDARATDALLKTQQVADQLGKSARDVQRLVKKGKLRKVPNLGSRTTRFRQADVDRLLADQGDERPGRRRL